MKRIPKGPAIAREIKTKKETVTKTMRLNAYQCGVVEKAGISVAQFVRELMDRAMKDFDTDGK